MDLIKPSASSTRSPFVLSPLYGGMTVISGVLVNKQFTPMAIMGPAALAHRLDKAREGVAA